MGVDVGVGVGVGVDVGVDVGDSMVMDAGLASPKILVGTAVPF